MDLVLHIDYYLLLGQMFNGI